MPVYQYVVSVTNQNELDMKRLLAIVLLAVALTVPSEAQVKFGVKGGLNLTNVSINDIDDAISNKSGFFVGPTVKFTLPIVGLGVDVAALYDQREGKIKDTDVTLKQQTVQIPVHLRWGFGLGSTASIYLFAGPQFGFNVGEGDKKFNIAEWSVKTAQVSGNAGLGVMLLKHLQVSANYNFALSKSGEVTVKDAAGNTVTGKAKNNAWQIAVAYFF